ncbi:MAG: histidine kinase [Bacteroidetes bacterium HGW-Bacteroidetes-21]|jgi:signal transduction histidine kinase|nr:MAG: histidine kinase [Bacteroidetes bacterium HGW-Bacteroidetes-21]
MNRLTDKELIKELENRFSENDKALKELNALTSQLTTLNKHLEESEAMKSHFLSNIRNEIINPFAAIIGLSSSLINSDNYGPDQIKHILSLIFSEAFHLDFQLQNIFAAAEIEAGEVALQINKVDVYSVIEQTVSSFQHMADKNKIKLSLQNTIEKTNDSTSFLTDQLKFQIILKNVISNAIQYSHADSEVKIITEFTSQMLTVTVKDNGIGIAKEEEKLIFDRFKKADSNINTLNKGHGLGLSVCNDYLEFMNGSIYLESSPGNGSTFIIKIPVSSESGNQNTLASDGNIFLFEEGELF